ncbi:MAG: hypothetical protein ACXW5W_20895 [Candidatus Binatia bacterium]
MAPKELAKIEFDKLGPWLILATIATSLIILVSDLVPGVIRGFSDPELYRAVGLFLLRLAVVSILGGLFGISLGKMILQSRLLTDSTLRFLRYGIWFAVIVAFGIMVPDNRIPLTGMSQMRTAVLTALCGAGPSVLLASCYQYLQNKVSDPGVKYPSTRYAIHQVISHSFVLCFFHGMLLSSARWPWEWWSIRADPSTMLVGCLSVIAVASLLQPFNLPLSIAAPVRRWRVSSSYDRENLRSLLGSWIQGLGFCIVSFWIYDWILQDALLHVSFNEHVRAVRGLVFDVAATGGPREIQSVWYDIGFSSIEIIGGVVIAVLAALVLGKLAKRDKALSDFISRWISLANLSLISIWGGLLVIGVSPFLVYSKLLLIASLVFYPLMESLWAFQSLPLFRRVLIAVSEVLPIAFIGMLFAESFAATKGLGFVAVVTRVADHHPKSAAALVIVAMLLVATTSLVRFGSKRVDSISR